MNRRPEERAAKDAAYRRSLAKTGKALLSDARRLSDEEVLGKLRSLNLTFDRESFARSRAEFASAEEMAGNLCKEIGINCVWLSLTVLWERWFPEEPSFEMLDDKIQEGYRAQTEEEPDTACRIWLKAWHWLLWILERYRIPSIHDFDERFRGTQSIFKW